MIERNSGGTVVSLRGGEICQPGEVNPNCVEALEEVLERARSGDVIGVAIVMLGHDETAGFHIAGAEGGHQMLGAAYRVCSELDARLREQD